MQCQQANEYLSDYVDRALDPALTVSVDNHVAACAACRENVDGMRRMWTQLNAMPQATPPAFLHSAIMDALDAHQTAEQPSSRPKSVLRAAAFTPRAFAYAAALLILALGSLEVVHSQRASFDPLGVLLQVIHAAAPAGDALPSVTGADSSWSKSADGVTLNVHLQADASTAVPGSVGSGANLAALEYRADLMQGNANTLAAHPAIALATVRGHFNDGGKAALALLVPAGTDANTPDLALLVTLSLPSANGGNTRRVIVIPLKSGGTAAAVGK